jgi:hypothetical protein
MKKSIVTCMCFVAAMVMAQAQTEVLTLEAVKKGAEPKEVMDAIKQDFPKAIVGDLNFLPSLMYGEHWSADLKDNLNGAAPNHYQVSLREKNERFTAAYDKNGKLLSTKTIIKDGALPSEITKTIVSKYPTWKIVNDREKIIYKNGVLKEAYRIQISEDKMHRILFFDGSGKLIKDVLLRSSK